MRVALIYFLVFGVGLGGIVWLVWDYINHLRRQIVLLSQRVRELEDRNAELVLALEERADVMRLDEAIRKGRVGQ